MEETEELKQAKMQTPIEIALGIDEEGMTTARKLYDFLELAQGQFSRWAKSNIVDNEFAVENEDFWRFDINVETPTGGIVKRDDYKLTAHFAKKLSMKGNGEKAEEAREYFTHLEERVKQKVIDLNQLSPELQMFQKIFNSVAEQQLEQKRQAEQLNHVEQRVESIREVVALDTTSWRDDTGNILRKISMELGGGQAYSQVRAESYELLSKRMGVNLKQRLTNKRRRMADEEQILFPCMVTRLPMVPISGRSKVSMKKFAKVIEMIGTVVFLFCICIDATEYPVTAIPVLIGLLLIYIGTKIDGEWQEYTEEIVDYDYRSESDDDDGITYITFDTDYSKEKESSEPTKAE